MKNKTSIKLMAATVLASTLLLGACGNKKENTASDNSSKTTQASSSSKTNSSNKESKTQASTSTTTSEKAKASSEQASSPTTQGQEANRAAQTPQAPQQQETPAQSNQQGTQANPNQSAYDPATDRKLQDKQAEHNKRYKGVLTMVDKDFSAAAGNWKGANGETITVSSNGQFTVESAEGKKENYSIQSYSYTLDDGKYNAEVGGGKIIQITTGADGTVSSVVLIQP